jgi:hypothetical protein
MTPTEALKSMDETTNHYLKELNNYSLEELNRKPSENEWSLGQMYVHLINSTLYMQLGNIEKCRIQTIDSALAVGEKTEAGEAILAQGSFPPTRIHVPPSPQYTPKQPETKEQLVDGLNNVMKRMKEVEPSLDDISPSHKVDHPRLGALNAKEWFTLIEMHFRHHLHQMERLKQAF